MGNLIPTDIRARFAPPLETQIERLPPAEKAEFLRELGEAREAATGKANKHSFVCAHPACHVADTGNVLFCLVSRLSMAFFLINVRSGAHGGWAPF